MTDAPPRRRFGFDAASLVALCATALAIGAVFLSPIGGGASHAAAALGALAAVALVLCLPAAGGRRALRDGARVGLAWMFLLLALGLAALIALVGPIGLAVLREASGLATALAALVAAHLLVVLLAGERRRALAPSERWAWRSGMVLPSVALLLGASPAIYPHYARFHPFRPSFASGVEAVRRLGACARAWTTSHGGVAPADLEAPGAKDPACRVEARGWRVAYELVPGRPGGFTLVVRERVAPFAAYRSLATDESGAIWVADGATDAGAGDAFLTNIPRELWKIDECVRAVIESRPGRETPLSLPELGPRGEACGILEGAEWNADGTATLTVTFAPAPTGEGTAAERYRFAYAAEPDSAGAPHVRVDARPVRYPVDGLRSYALIDGVVHATADDRPARGDDPAADRCEEFWSFTPGCARPPEGMGWSHGDLRAPAPALPPLAAVLPARDSGIVWAAPLGDRPREGVFAALAAPAVGAGGAVYAASRAGVYAFAPDGARRWSRPDLGVVDEGGVALIGDQLLVPTRDSGLAALDPATGATRWTSRAVPGVLTHSPVALPGGAIAVTNAAGTLTVFERDGRVRWTRRLGNAFNTPPVADGRGTLYVVADGRETELVIIGAEGRERRRVRVGGWRTPPAFLPDGTVLVASGEGLFAVDPKAGPARKLAASATDADRLLVRPDGSVVFTDRSALIAMAGNGRRLWTWQPADRPPSLEGPALRPDGTIVVVGGGLLRAVSATGDSLWVAHLDDASLASTPAVGPDGTVYVADTRWRITAVRR